MAGVRGRKEEITRKKFRRKSQMAKEEMVGSGIGHLWKKKASRNGKGGRKKGIAKKKKKTTRWIWRRAKR